MILKNTYTINNTLLKGKVSPSNLRYVGVEEELIDAYEEANSKLQAYCSLKEEMGDEYSREEEEERRASKFNALNAIENRLAELSNKG